MTGTLSMARILAISATLSLISSSACKIKTTVKIINVLISYQISNFFSRPSPQLRSIHHQAAKKRTKDVNKTTTKEQKAERTSSNALRMSS